MSKSDIFTSEKIHGIFTNFNPMLSNRYPDLNYVIEIFHWKPMATCDFLGRGWVPLSPTPLDMQLSKNKVHITGLDKQKFSG